jgi:hypothetical protein
MKLHRTRARLERAKVHSREFGRIWNNFLKQDEPYAISVPIDRDGTGVIYVEPVDLPREALSLELGEMLYQLRAALDSLVYELAIIDSGQNPPPDADKLEFPIRSSKSSFDQAAWKIAPLSKLHRDMVESVQPYDVAQRPEGHRVAAQALEVINDLARKDRHRGLRVVASWGANRNPHISAMPTGCSLEWLTTAPDGILEHESVVARFKLRGWHSDLEIEANPDLTIDVTIEDAAPPVDDEDTLFSRVRTMIAVVVVVIEGFENTLD